MWDVSCVDDFVQDMLECVWCYCWWFQLWFRFGLIGQIGVKGEGDGLFVWLFIIMYWLYLNVVCWFDWIELSDLFFEIFVEDDFGLCCDLLCVLVMLFEDQWVVLLFVGLEQFVYKEVVDVLEVLVGMVMLWLLWVCEWMCVVLDGLFVVFCVLVVFDDGSSVVLYCVK